MSESVTEIGSSMPDDSRTFSPTHLALAQPNSIVNDELPFHKHTIETLSQLCTEETEPRFRPSFHNVQENEHDLLNEQGFKEKQVPSRVGSPEEEDCTEQLTSSIEPTLKRESNGSDCQSADEPALKKPKLEVEESGESAMADMLMSEEFLSVEIKEEEDDDDEEEEEDVRRPFKKANRKRNIAPKPVITYQCTICDYSSTKLFNYKHHIEATHVGIRYPCDQCDYQARAAGHLKLHKESVHERRQFPCDQCDFVSTANRNLRRHKRTKHEGIRFACEQCEFTTTRPVYLRKHVETVHTDKPKDAILINMN